jgi:polar amino acid transport system substrate-binding protein
MGIAKARLLVCMFAVCTIGLARADKPLAICDDEAGWPPYTFVDPNRPQEVVGASADLIVEILRRAGYRPTITLLPWKRCLAEVENGKMAMFMNAAYSAERSQKYLISNPYYSLRSALYYLDSKFPDAPKMSTTDDLKRYRYCGLFGYNYTMYDLPEAQLDTGAKDEASRFRKLRMGRCDFVLGDIELLNSFSSMGQVDLDGVSHIPIPGAKPKEFHVMVSMTPAGGKELLQVINDGLAASKADKTYARIFKKYGM